MGAPETGEGCGADNTAQTAELELGEDLDHQDIEPVEVVQGQFADGGTGNNDAETGIIQLLDGSFETVFLALCEVKHLLGVLQENSTLGLGLGGYRWGS